MNDYFILNLVQICISNKCQQTKDYIQDVFDNYEPRAEFITSDVSFDHDRNRADITVRFRLINSVEPTTLSVILERTR